jgi:NAD-dependent deacetylase
MTRTPLDAVLDRCPDGGRTLFLTGAGISAESGIPTFRGPEGYWTIGSRHYRPMELATREAFDRMPGDVWGWYLHRRSMCRSALPNAAHVAVAALDRRLGDRFLLVTQNVDGLHLRAGNPSGRTYEIHGNIDFMRCANDCTKEAFPIPEALGTPWDKGRAPGPVEKALLVCPRCGGAARPHVLWFDEYYDEEHFRFESSLRAAGEAALLVVVGTSGATNLPSQMCAAAAKRRTPMIVVDPEPTTFSELAERSGGVFLQGKAAEVVPELAERIG